MSSWSGDGKDVVAIVARMCRVRSKARWLRRSNKS